MTKIIQLAKQVMAALSEDPRTSDATIDVVDNNGIVTLVGTVNSEEVRQAAKEVAGKQEGVIEVIDDLQLEREEELPVQPIAPAPMQNL